MIPTKRDPATLRLTYCGQLCAFARLPVTGPWIWIARRFVNGFTTAPCKPPTADERPAPANPGVNLLP